MRRMARVALLLMCVLTGCRDTPPESKARPTSSPTAATTPAPSASPTSTSTVSPAAKSALEKKLIGRWKGTYEAEFKEKSRYVIHGGAKEIPGEWKVKAFPAEDTIEVVVELPGLNSKDFISIRFLDDDRIEWLQKRHRAGAKPVVFKRVAPVTP